jgi:inhibitor of cysteine peptidase
MTIKIAVPIVFLLLTAGLQPARAELCPKCRDLMFTDSVGKCVGCGGATTSGALKLCPKCSTSQHKCECCKGPVDGWTDPSAAKPAAVVPVSPAPATSPVLGTPAAVDKPADAGPAIEKPAPVAKSPVEPFGPEGTPIEKLPEAKSPVEADTEQAPPPIDRTKSGTYNWGKWQYRMEVSEVGKPNEGRWGWLSYNGQKLPRGQVNDYYRTPWGPIYWVDAPQVRWGPHGWMPTPLAQNNRRGRPLTLPASLTAAAAATTPAASKAPSATAKRPGEPSNPSASSAPDATKPAGTKPASPNRQTLELTKADSGKRARLWPGNVVVIRLPGNPTTGYQWQAVPTGSAVVRMMGQPQYAASPQVPGMTGAGGTYTFMFQAVQPGAGTIRLAYARPSDRGRPAAEVFGVSVEVLSPQTRPAGATSPPSGTRSYTGYGAARGR